MLFGFGVMCVAEFATSGFSGGSACAIFFFLAELLTFGNHLWFGAF
jgi:hypothetical protein